MTDPKVLEEKVDKLSKQIEALSKNLPAIRQEVPVALKLPTVQELKDNLCPGISDGDAFIFLETAKAHGLNPFKKEIHLMPFWDPDSKKKRYSAVVDYHVFLARARLNPTYLYFEAGLRMPEDGTKKPDGAWCKIYDEKFGKDKDGNPNFFYHEIDASEYDKQQATWKSKRNTMLKKTAIRQAHNLCYPELAGLPEPKMEIIDASGMVLEEEQNNTKSSIPKTPDKGFFTGKSSDAEETPSPQDKRKALKPQIKSLGKLVEHQDIPTDIGNELAKVLDAHNNGEEEMTAGEASEWIRKAQRGILEAKKAKQEKLPV